MPAKVLIANWKMNVPPEGIDAYLCAVAAAQDARAAIVVAPPFVYLGDVAGRVPLGAQNCADQPAGAFTGEVSPRMLAEAGAKYVIVGHSERRNLFGETDAFIARKLALALETGLTPVLCVGENQQVRDDGDAAVFVAGQILAVAAAVGGPPHEIIVAYEPVWAIGTGRNATGAMVAEMVAVIRGAMRRFWPPPHAGATPVLYGGSVTPDNIADLGANGGIDGYLVGGASLDSAKLLAIHRGLLA
jgi:triosephosphate isomerase